ncbi:packaging and recombination endonuclease VII [Escherichia phage PSD2001]|nr:packaging and recombination endonuclease VII [Escherichia phage PSD2001]
MNDIIRRLGKEEMIREMLLNGMTYNESDTKTQLMASFKKQLRKSLK